MMNAEQKWTLNAINPVKWAPPEQKSLNVSLLDTPAWKSSHNFHPVPSPEKTGVQLSSCPTSQDCCLWFQVLCCSIPCCACTTDGALAWQACCLPMLFRRQSALASKLWTSPEHSGETIWVHFISYPGNQVCLHVLWIRCRLKLLCDSVFPIGFLALRKDLSRNHYVPKAV